MRVTRFDHLLQVKITEAHKRKLNEASERIGVNLSEVTRLSLRLRLKRLLDKIPAAEAANE